MASCDLDFKSFARLHPTLDNVMKFRRNFLFEAVLFATVLVKSKMSFSTIAQLINLIMLSEHEIAFIFSPTVVNLQNYLICTGMATKKRDICVKHLCTHPMPLSATS